ncbi:hypothetical protein [Pseudanabaena sp. PCC 6802]|uniref:hypothetical protein n=1 Tax=Pseudanabaena sp. PCC 6802 TaxID=118173 RepID=UPI00034749DC|nr:hypothetical protein [Pseudanabaena sp. PCC 6802]
MSIPPEILALAQQLTDELDRIELQANKGLVLVSQFLERFPDDARLISLSVRVGNGLFFVDGFRNRIESIIESVSDPNVSIEAIQLAGEELSEFWGRTLECKIVVNRAMNILESLQ